AMGGLLLWGQADINIKITKEGGLPVIAIPDFRGSGGAQAFMDIAGGFNATLWDEISGSGALKMAPKTFYPLDVPRQPTDFRSPPAGAKVFAPGNGRYLADWSGPPVHANYLAFGYTGVQDNRLALFGYLYGVNTVELQRAQLIGKVYYGTLD